MKNICPQILGLLLLVTSMACQAVTPTVGYTSSSHVVTTGHIPEPQAMPHGPAPTFNYKNRAENTYRNKTLQTETYRNWVGNTANFDIKQPPLSDQKLFDWAAQQ